MTVKELIELVKDLDPNTLIISSNGLNYHILESSSFKLKELYPDLTGSNNSRGKSGEKEQYLVVNTHNTLIRSTNRF